MKKFFRASILIGLLLIFSQGIVRGEETQPTERTFIIPEAVIVSGSRITFFDLVKSNNQIDDAGNSLKKIELGAAPLPGQVRTFSKDYLNLIIKQNCGQDVINLKMGTEVAVRTKATCIKGEEIQKEIKELLTEEKANFLERWVELQNLPKEIWLNQDKWEIKANPIGNLPVVGRALFKVVITNGTESKSMNISGKIKATASVYKAIRDISSLTEVNLTDFQIIKMELETGKELVGDIPIQTRITKKVKRGEILKTDLLEPIPLVCKNHSVKIVIRNKNVIINIIGVAIEDGWLGDNIKVANPSSYKVFRAKVTGSGIAEVDL